MSSVLIASALLLSTLPGADSYAAAREAERSGRCGDAYKLYTACAEVDDILRPYALVRGAGCQARAGDRDAALARLEALAADASLGAAQRLAQVELASWHERAKRHSEAAALLRRAVDVPVRPQFLRPYQLALVDCLVATKEGEAEGYALCARLLADARTRSQRIEAAERLEKSPDLSHVLAAADAYLFSGEDREAKRVLLAAAPALILRGADHRPQSLYLQARLQLGAKDGTGRIMLREVAENYPDSPWAADALLYLGRDLFGAGQVEAAKTVFDSLANDYPGADQTARGLLWFGQRLASKGDRTDAAAVLVKLAEVCPEHKLADDALLEAGNQLRAAKKIKEAIAAYQRLATHHPYAPMTGEALFESGRLRESQGDTDGAVDDYAKAARLIGQFHAHRAAERLHELGKLAAPDLRATGARSFVRPVPLGALPEPDHSDSIRRAAWYQRVTFFSSLGLEEAEWEAIGLIPAIVTSDTPGAYYGALADAGLMAMATQIADDTGWGLKDGAPTLERLRVFYPRAYWNEVQRVALETGLDPYLILAVGRQESIFQPRVVSVAGATGVMQLMPGTADWLAKVEPAVTTDHVANLTHPANSLRLGAYYLTRMVARNDANLVYALASYNAGPGNVSKWKKQIPTSDMEAFVEAIPFAETRGFVKKVLGNYGAYHSLYPEPSRIASLR